ncbi:alpha/beta hydrolase domain-containing protein [Mycobacterium sp. AT1]|uniref:alpha/beta hydrolase domain-containing protein n=1 Tax=Mycobacterium sp. AT1 TaxID=1961706 RepID=UPI0009AE4A23|nr:alpha/beta hydrolase domain-containing protein [Mycobacterium sp. AT1]OPX13264.1 hypothetical protein B1790_00930 [Mycobacterium sp. AT1]
MTGGRHGWPFGACVDDLQKFGYTEEEYFLSGNAVRYRPTSALTFDGRWSVRADSAAPFRTRVLVRRPLDPSRFSGLVVVEWANVSAGYEISFAVPPSLYSGHAYVAVSTQPHGVHGFPSRPEGLTAWDPPRYGRLLVSDDAVGYDIFTQAARLLRAPDGSPLLGGLRARQLIGVGASQSGTRILAYLNAVQPIEQVFDAFMPLICAGRSADFEPEAAHPDTGAGARGHSRAVPVRVRDDVSTRTLVLNTETEAAEYAPLRQPDSDVICSWEVAGASHGPAPQLEAVNAIVTRDGLTPPRWSAGRPSEVPWLPTFDAAVGHVHRWITDGLAPPTQPPLAVRTDVTLLRDEYGNARGGIRLPELEVPTATYRGSDTGAELAGSTTPFTADTLTQLYPTHRHYVEKVRAAAAAAMDAGVILPRRAEEYVRQAERAPIPPGADTLSR